MAAGKTYEPIATTTLTSAQTGVTFSSISGSYTDLVLVANVKVTGQPGRNATVQFNSDTGSNYSFSAVYGDGSSASSFRVSTISYGRLANFGTGIGNAIAQFQNYSNTTTYKTWLSRSNDGGVGVLAFANLWRNTAAISTIALSNFGNSLNIASGSTFTLYGIKAA